MVFVIVLSYHAPVDLRRCIASVLRTDYPPERFRLVVVDNEATEETAAVLQDYAGRIVILPQRENTGFAEGMNIGIRHALAQGAEYVVCLNQDTEVDPGWLKHLVMAMEADSKLGAVQPRVMLGQTTDDARMRPTDGARITDAYGGMVNSIGNEIHVLGFAYAGGHRERWEDVRKRLRGFPYPEVTYCSGACVMLRAAALRDVALTPSRHFDQASPRARGEISLRDGAAIVERDLSTPLRSARDDASQYFDSSYFMYHEDVDLGVRLRLRGWTCALAPQAVVTHFYEFSRSMRKLEWMERNRALFLLENFRWPTLFLLAPALLASELALVAFAIRGGWWPAKRRAWAALLHPANWETYRRARAVRQATRTLPDRVVLRRCTARFANQEMPNTIVDRIINPLVAAWWAVVRPCIRW